MSTPAAELEGCWRCERVSEACQYCEGVSEGDWRAMCDCGLRHFGAHLVDCEKRNDYKYVIASDYESAALPRCGA